MMIAKKLLQASYNKSSNLSLNATFNLIRTPPGNLDEEYFEIFQICEVVIMLIEDLLQQI